MRTTHIGPLPHQQERSALSPCLDLSLAKCQILWGGEEANWEASGHVANRTSGLVCSKLRC
eukprot:5340557-Amphidinium_carterae.2